MTPEEKKARAESLRNRIENFKRQGKGSDPRCVDAMQELDRLVSGGLEFSESLSAIKKAAAARGFISYGKIAAASKLSWAQARRPMNRHLDELCAWAHAQGWPLITAVVVEEDNLKTGRLGEAAMAGFISCARRCGIVVGQDEEKFLREQQERTFVWAAQEIAR